MRKRIKLIARSSRFPVRDGVGQALRDAYEIVDEGDARMQQLLEQIRNLKGEGEE